MHSINTDINLLKSDNSQKINISALYKTLQNGTIMRQICPIRTSDMDGIFSFTTNDVLVYIPTYNKHTTTTPKTFKISVNLLNAKKK